MEKHNIIVFCVSFVLLCLVSGGHAKPTGNDKDASPVVLSHLPKPDPTPSRYKNLAYVINITIPVNGTERTITYNAVRGDGFKTHLNFGMVNVTVTDVTTIEYTDVNGTTHNVTYQTRSLVGTTYDWSYVYYKEGNHPADYAQVSIKGYYRRDVPSSTTKLETTTKHMETTTQGADSVQRNSAVMAVAVTLTIALSIFS